MKININKINHKLKFDAVYLCFSFMLKHFEALAEAKLTTTSVEALARNPR